MDSLKRAEMPEDVGVSSKALVAFLKDIERSKLDNHSFMVLRGGVVAAEWYKAPYQPDIAHSMYSVSKSVVALAVGYAVEEDLLTLDTAVYKHFPEYDIASTERNKHMTVFELLTMTTGKHIPYGGHLAAKDWTEAYFKSTWRIGYTAGQNGFVYTNENFYLLCALLRKVTGKTVTDYLMPRLFAPLGIERPMWETDRKGTECGGWGLYLKTEDFARIMLTVAKGGKYNGKQVIPAGWIELATKKQVETPETLSESKYGYGLGFWMNGPGGYRADGVFGQFGIVMPEHDAVIIVTGSVPDEEDMLRCVWRHFPAAFDVPEDSTLSFAELSAKVEKLSMLNIPVSNRGDMEKNISGKLYRLKRRAVLKSIGLTLSILPLPLTIVFSDRPDGHPDNFRFDFLESELRFRWSEGNAKYSVLCGMDGRLRHNILLFGGYEFKAFSAANWINETTLVIRIIPVGTIASRTLIVRFENDRMYAKFLGKPSVPALISAIGKNPVMSSNFPIPKSLLKIAKRAVTRYSNPTVRGRVQGI